MEKKCEVPMLLPYEPKVFWTMFRQIIQEEIGKLPIAEPKLETEVAGLTKKPLYKTDEICRMFNVSRTTIHEWVKTGKLRKIKVRSRVYFLSNDIQQF